MAEADHSAALLDFYVEAVGSIDGSRKAFFELLPLAQPSIEEAHHLNWTRDVEEREVERLTAEVADLTSQLEERRVELMTRETTMQAMRRDQVDDRVRIQRLLALCQPITGDLTFVVGGLEPSGAVGVTGRNAAAVAASVAGEDAAARLPPVRSQAYVEYLQKRTELMNAHTTCLIKLGGEYVAALRGDELERDAQADAQRQRADGLRTTLARRLATVDAVLENVTGDYLALRHNARQAHAANADEARRCADRERRADAQLAALVARLDAERCNLREAAARRVAARLAPLRTLLEDARSAALAARARHAALQRRHGDELDGARHGVAALKEQHARLHHRRARELVGLSAQLAGLRRAVLRMEAAARFGEAPAA